MVVVVAAAVVVVRGPLLASIAGSGCPSLEAARAQKACFHPSRSQINQQSSPRSQILELVSGTYRPVVNTSSSSAAAGTTPSAAATAAAGTRWWLQHAAEQHCSSTAAGNEQAVAVHRSRRMQLGSSEPRSAVLSAPSQHRDCLLHVPRISPLDESSAKCANKNQCAQAPSLPQALGAQPRTSPKQEACLCY